MLASYRNLVEEYAITIEPEDILIWAGSPRKVPYILNRLRDALIASLIAAILIVIHFLFPGRFYKLPIMAAVVILYALAQLTIQLFSWKNILYVVTKRKIIFYTRFINYNIKHYNREQIKDQTITGTIFDRKLGTRSIAFNFGETDSDGKTIMRYFDSIDIESVREVFSSIKTQLV